MTNNYQYGTRNKIIKDILRLEKEVRFIPLHQETLETLEKESDEYLARYRWQLLELRTRNGGK
jgi:hypothetical protein